MLYLVDIKQKFRDWKSKRHYEHDAYRDVLSYDLVHQRFKLDRVTTKQKDIVPSDKIVTGTTYHYFVSEIPRLPRKVLDNEGHVLTTPTTDYEFLTNNDVNDATTALMREQKNTNALIMGVLAGVGVAVVGFIIYTMVL